MTRATASSRAIVLSRENFGEADQYIQFFTQNWGVISVLARSARKSKRRYIGGLDLFCHDEIFIRGNPRERPYLNELVVLNSFVGLREDLDKLTTAGKVVQWIRRLADPGTSHPAIYLLLGQTLALIEREKETGRLEFLSLLFRLKLLHQLGFKPRVEACVRCQGELESPTFFEWASGGTVCRKCLLTGTVQEGVSVAADERLLLGVGDRLKLSTWEQFEFPLDKTHQLSRLIHQFAFYHTHVRLPL
jgi:DNA repair protein RecO (recombination protein O)